MKLPFAFYRLPLQIDVERLQAEVARFAESDWQRHPTGFEGNSAVRLITVGGGENDDFAGAMASTPHLQRSPYIRQILATFGVAWSRSRLMRLAPGAGVPAHTDINYHWVNRVRVHIPVQTAPEVSFSCGEHRVSMAAGEAWLFDNWRTHAVHNGSARDRIHLVADTCGSAAFWQMASASQVGNFTQPPPQPPQRIDYRPDVDARPLFERYNVTVVMHPAEVQLLVGDLLSDLRPPATPEQQRATHQFTSVVLALCREWRMLWSLFGESPEGWPHYRKLRDWATTENSKQSAQIVCNNGAVASEVLHARVLLNALLLPHESSGIDLDRTMSVAAQTQQPAAPAPVLAATRRVAPTPPFSRPIFIVAAPRSGSSLLFETLAQARDLATVGGESHWLVERLPQLQPGARGVDSNRLTAAHVDDSVRQHIVDTLAGSLRYRDGAPLREGAVRFLEKTPKNALRIPFFDALFPDARFIYLWRDPRENLGSIIEAWRAGGWVTYPQLDGWEGPWSLLLPPGWQTLRGAALEEVAAFQWRQTNQILLDDLEQLPPERRTVLSYADFLRSPAAEVQRLCRFADVDFDAGLAAYLERPLPLSAHTLTPPADDKWRAHEAAIAGVLPGLQPVMARIAEFAAGTRQV